MTTLLSTPVKSLLMLLATLFIGIVLGASVTGAVVRSRLSAVAALGTEEGFVEKITVIIEPSSEEQAKEITPILRKAGAEMEALLTDTRSSSAKIFDTMSVELAPYLSDEQRNGLEKKRARFRSRYFHDRQDEQAP